MPRLHPERHELLAGRVPLLRLFQAQPDPSCRLQRFHNGAAPIAVDFEASRRRRSFHGGNIHKGHGIVVFEDSEIVVHGFGPQTAVAAQKRGDFAGPPQQPDHLVEHVAG